jgi:hypothetical protein
MRFLHWGDLLYWRSTVQWVIWWPRYVKAEDFPDGDVPTRWGLAVDSWRHTCRSVRDGERCQTVRGWVRLRRRRRAAQRTLDRLMAAQAADALTGRG